MNLTCYIDFSNKPTFGILGWWMINGKGKCANIQSLTISLLSRYLCFQKKNIIGKSISKLNEFRTYCFKSRRKHYQKEYGRKQILWECWFILLKTPSRNKQHSYLIHIIHNIPLSNWKVTIETAFGLYKI